MQEMNRHTMRVAIAAALFLATGAGTVLSSSPVLAQAAQTATITGNVVDQQTGLGLSGTSVVLFQAGRRIAETTTDNAGTFTFANQPAGIYDLEFAVNGYQRARLTDQAVAPGTAGITLRVVLTRATGEGSLRIIGRVNATRSALATTTVINRNIDPIAIQSEAKLRVGDALLAAPGLTSFNLDSAPGDDLNISIRGQRPSEAQLLIDGHPVGPQGVFNGTGGGFNYQLSPSFALNNIAITYGTGGAALTGVQALAGTIDFQTIDPTRTPEFSFKQGFGTQARSQTVAQATGTIGRLGYAFVHGVEGSVGGFDPQVVTQSGLLAGDATSANVAANTWLVTGNYVLRNSLGKLRYQLSPKTSVALGFYDATSWDDKTGEGDNDFVTPEFALYSAQQGGNTCTLPDGSTGYLAATDANPNACFTPAQYASTFSGPSGGTPLAFQTLHLQDYNYRLTTALGANTIVVEGFQNAFYQYYDRNLAGFTNKYRTVGGRISDDFVTDHNDLGIGFLSVAQIYQSGTYGPKGVKNKPDVPQVTNNVFLRDIYKFGPALTAFANLNLQHSSVTATSSLDPRLSLVYNPKGVDIYRVSVGRGTEAPNASLKSSPPNVTTQPGALNPNCGGLNSIGSSSNPTLVDEKANSIELSYGHRFSNDSNFQIVGYDQEISNPIFSSVLPLTTFGPSAVPANLAAYLARISGYCGRPATIAQLALTSATNAGAGRFRGISATERYRVTRSFLVDAGLDVLSARYYGVPILSQQNNVTLINGGQLVGVPFMKANLGLDFTFNSKAEVRFDGYFVGRNNALYRPPFSYADGFFSTPLQHGLTLNIGVSNMFNSQYDQYGRFGYAQYLHENAFGSDANALQEQFNGNFGERFGLPERSFVFSVSTRVR
ncbi:hypothetical protein WPS_27300 [Vulcanimicrobium alpinum]|uniref:TonB-dependent receptor plug domain-containing protein n=2 Tax=Vulcanimicrobium alpinum TaxID=3016050 RepID=A0AAN2CAK5_UNVUL|nr:hypothetical protein WPS_27300 [Vulcanimicrobium alpinum]